MPRLLLHLRPASLLPFSLSPHPQPPATLARTFPLHLQLFILSHLRMRDPRSRFSAAWHAKVIALDCFGLEVETVRAFSAFRFGLRGNEPKISGRPQQYNGYKFKPRMAAVPCLVSYSPPQLKSSSLFTLL